ncbi:N-acetylneuraminate synthase [Candidatus Woesearchaeota archaeon]|jgi:N,N'-diacetyllegionaminate synthase|nr:N-acetylneuraminate synthase [Candidatus Woesearchaeota archaeon]MBT3538436.1 N-acetylneuraminate synthase [Candidatus Woesearchaeota archaeon]MBT4696999.1 N-acetylneuraminate synthase [Candidatus Woesearchaeota archaeon]MBT7106108.1 N-acetylneuraminate synthase [Candidatus Woesearchaeota archaeon]MBT7930994.1 N-acetylneuraminate synthase [Candidatus Woesearchaeota archaeon]
MKKEITIESKKIGEMNSCFIIAEAGVNHNGSFATAKKLVDAAADAGADAVKFQTYTTEKLVTKNVEMADYQKENLKTDGKQVEMLKNLELSLDDFKRLKQYCDGKNIIFLSTPHTEDVVDFLDTIMPAYKISSGDLTNLPYLEKLAKKNKPILLSTGASTLDEVEEAVDLISKSNSNLILLHCTVSYPCKREDVNLRAMTTMHQKFEIPTGYSDHTEGINIPLMAVKLGATVIEKHFTLDKNMDGPDHKISLDPSELKEMVEKIRNNVFPEDDEVVMGSKDKKPTEYEINLRKIVRKSIVAKQNIRSGVRLTEDMFEIKRPGTGLAPKELKNILGREALTTISEGELISKSQLKKRVLITGGAGFIGSFLMKELGVKYDFISLSLDNGNVKTELNAEFIDGSILNEDILRKATENIDVILHLAGGGGEASCLKDPGMSVKVNLLGTQLLIKYAKLNKVSRIIFPSSIYAYTTCKEKNLPLKEKDKLEPDTFYGSIKASCEEMLLNSEVNYVIFRLANIYGVGNKNHTRVGGAVGNFVNAVVDNSDITVFNKGTNIIDYLNISDLIIPFEKAINGELDNNVYNLGGGSPISILNLAELIIELARNNNLDYKKNIIMKMNELPTLADLWLDISKAERDFDWRPQVDFERGLKDMLNFKRGLR